MTTFNISIKRDKLVIDLDLLSKTDQSKDLMKKLEDLTILMSKLTIDKQHVSVFRFEPNV